MCWCPRNSHSPSWSFFLSRSGDRVWWGCDPHWSQPKSFSQECAQFWAIGWGRISVRTASYRESQPSFLFWDASAHHVSVLSLFVVLWGQRICFLKRQVAFSFLQPPECFIIYVSFSISRFLFDLSALDFSTTLFNPVGWWLLPFFCLFTVILVRFLKAAWENAPVQSAILKQMSLRQYLERGGSTSFLFAFLSMSSSYFHLTYALKGTYKVLNQLSVHLHQDISW